MNIYHVKMIAIVTFVLFCIATMMFAASPQRAAVVASDDTAGVYKAKCAACHLPNASKFFDSLKAEETHVEAILKGRKGEKPPFMPGFEAKGMTVDEAKALAGFMKGLRGSAN